MKKKLVTSLSVIGSLALLWTGNALAVSFSTFVGGTGGSPIGFAYAGNKFVGSNYFNNQLADSISKCNT